MEEGLALVVERKGKKRKRKKMREDRGRPFCQDPLDGLGRDLMLRVLNNFDARSLALCLVVSRTWNRVASSDLLWTSKNRIMRDDLCDHVWEFHFTKAAPEYWRNLDPYWKGNGPPMHRYFHPDGSQTADPGDKVWGGHESCYSIVTSIIGEGKIREHYVRINRWRPLAVSRKQDWSWEMTNNLFCYSSIPDAYKEGGTGPLFLVM
ncbi:uncharacterized protein LOC18102811 isoform X5 [Populus trichocarpa]|uniref:uncharacterized protein LOC18102811 isoform X5 n=1 Tax=Populus trichocarpa TaxID=3694 RepID=UPI000D18A243|nr:uncharacterized protein LOC18102811 isoform X5 [Populus trichocarpa]|eukprot:XP_024465329.1 uncharacterized protein LOC18102811 isoform X4 [Populus trichocarpa]